MKKFWNGVKQVFKDFAVYIKDAFKTAVEVIKIFFSSWRNWIMIFAFIVSIVFISLWTVAPWCKFIGVASLTIALGFLAWYLLIFYSNFVQVIEQQKREILEELATQFDKKEYLELKTPFKENEEKLIKAKIKSYKTLMITFWIFFAVSLIFFISLFF